MLLLGFVSRGGEREFGTTNRNLSRFGEFVLSALLLCIDNPGPAAVVADVVIIIVAVVGAALPIPGLLSRQGMLTGEEKKWASDGKITLHALMAT